MTRNLDDLAAFLMVADERSFTRAAVRLGLSASALSHAITALEARLGVRLLARTTRSVATTQAGERLAAILRPALGDVAAGLAELSRLRESPSGTVRLTAPKHAAMSVLSPMLPGFLDAFPDVQVEVVVDEALTDIVAERYDAGIRFGEKVARDMVSVRIGPEVRAAVVAAPAYLLTREKPASPQDLASHRCINYRLPTSGRFYSWEFEQAGRQVQVRAEGALVFNDSDLILAAVLAGTGVAYMFEDQAAPYIAAGRLVRLLADWCPPFPGYYLYRPSRRQTPPALAALIDALRARANGVPG